MNNVEHFKNGERFRNVGDLVVLVHKTVESNMLVQQAIRKASAMLDFNHMII